MPFGTVKKKREATIILRILPEEKTAIAGEAGKAGLTVSEYIRRRALGKLVKSRVSEKAINELRRLGGSSGDTSKPAIKGHFKTGHFRAARVSRFIPCREDVRQ